MKLYGSKASVCTQRVLAVLNEAHGKYEFIPIALPKQEQKVHCSTKDSTDS